MQSTKIRCKKRQSAALPGVDYSRLGMCWKQLWGPKRDASTEESRSAVTESQTHVATQTSLGHACAVAGHLKPGRMHSDINWDCPPVDTWSSSGLKKFGIERRQIIRDLQSAQMPSAPWLKFIWKCRRLAQGLTNKVVCCCPICQQLCTAALQRAMKALALRNEYLAWTGRLPTRQSHRQVASEC
ncbi:unnamed protein product [Polarella glacialis]|uniref:Uncharacterized protein n=1 Tax=Polarella glacialis TaxID=89957 RepID=A0A813I4X7_POLGL|nr:unnamed protein product [Polarella glacialis]